MHRNVLSIAILCLAITSCVVAKDPHEPLTLTPEEIAEIAALVLSLGSDDYDIRIAADEKLRKRAYDALPVIRAIMRQSKDVELIVRSRRIIQDFENVYEPPERWWNRAVQNVAAGKLTAAAQDLDRFRKVCRAKPTFPTQPGIRATLQFLGEHLDQCPALTNRVLIQVIQEFKNTDDSKRIIYYGDLGRLFGEQLGTGSSHLDKVSYLLVSLHPKFDPAKVHLDVGPDRMFVTGSAAMQGVVTKLIDGVRSENTPRGSRPLRR